MLVVRKGWVGVILKPSSIMKSNIWGHYLSSNCKGQILERIWLKKATLQHCYSVQKDYNRTLKNFQDIRNSYFWVVVVHILTTLPTREVIGKPATTSFVVKFILKQEKNHSDLNKNKEII